MALALIVLATVVSYAAGWAIGAPVLVPILNTAAAAPFLIASLRAGRVADAVGRMLVWAAAMLVCATLLSYARPAATAALFLRGDTYQREMFDWLLTGAGAEGDPRRFVPQHAAHAAVFSGLALATGGAAAMPMGAMLMNYMGHYAGALGAASRRPLAAMTLAWAPWALVRIASFVILGVVLSGPVLAWLSGFSYRLRDHTGWLLLGGAGLLVDVVLKWLLAPAWRGWLLQASGW